MADMVTTYVTIIGDIEALRPHIITQDESGNDAGFDFNGVIPMPEVLIDTEAGSITHDAMAIFDEHEWNRLRRFPWFETRHPDVKSQRAWLEYLRGTDRWPMIRKIITSYLDTGYTDWYEWSTEKWGTKWNASGVEIVTPQEGDCIEIRFDTAWETPLPVLHKLADMGYKLEVTVDYYDSREVFELP